MSAATASGLAEVQGYSYDHGYSHDNDAKPLKRRKVRKGTQSCWECKRRKAKCSLTTTTMGDVCDGCRRRGSPCISQEFSDDPASHRQQLGDRIGRVEQLMKSLASRGLSRAEVSTLDPKPQDTSSHHRCSSGVYVEDTFTMSWTGELTDPQRKLAQLTATAAAGGRPNKFRELSNALMTAWPCDEDLEVIFSLPKSTVCVYYSLICVPYADIMDKPLPTPRELFKKPDATSHPTLIARSLLTLSLFLQSFNRMECDAIADQLQVSIGETMNRAFETAVRLVNSNDELVGTVEGVACLMMDASYRCHSGFLRLAYLASRRALTTAQVIGLNKGALSPLLRILELETRERVNPEYMWFRIVQADRYMSLHLGLPQGTAENAFAGPDEADGSDVEKLERGHAIAAGRILQRNASKMHDDKTTQEVDELLLKGANSMSPQWWLCPDLPTPCDDERVLLRESSRFVTQIAHYSLLERLHLPFLLRRSVGNEYDYNKMTAVTSSRELLARFLVFRDGFPPTGNYFRGVDFIAFGACTVICLGHIHTHLSRQGDGQSGMSSTVYNYLAHYRLSDRGMMERALAVFETSNNNQVVDPTAQKIYIGMKTLLAIEADLASGMAYRIDSMYCDNDVTNNGLGSSATEPDDSDPGLEVRILHLGTIKIKPQSITKSLQSSPCISKQVAEPPAMQASAAAAADHVEPLLGLPDAAYTYSFMGASDSTDGLGLNATDDPWTMAHSGSFSFNVGASQPVAGIVPNFYPADEWSLQGFDTAVFDSLFLESGYG